MAPRPEPFQLSVPETALADLKGRLASVRSKGTQAEE